MGKSKPMWAEMRISLFDDVASKELLPCLMANRGQCVVLAYYDL